MDAEDPVEPLTAQAQSKRSKLGNRLAKESSPYLLRHAKHPVDWYPWGPEALEKAKSEQKLIFLSIGYSTCHWCHVMEQTVFSNPEIARFLNEHFVNIKIDREERPDLDDVYMTALTIYFQQLKMPHSGGWPLSMFLTPDAKPLGGGTYMPPFDEDGRMGFMTVTKAVVEKWKSNRKPMEANADFLVRAVKSATRLRRTATAPALDEKLVSPAIERLAAGFDPQHGGFGYDVDDPDQPKFPVPVKLAFLRYESQQHSHQAAGQMLALTLDRMADGGIHDQAGGGFHRYSIDRKWRVPHFEKMLYDNAQLAELYAEVFATTGDVRYREVAEGIVAFVLRDLADPDGGFYSALDADTDGVEGKYYLWTRRDLAAALTPQEAQLVESLYGVQGQPPFEHGFVLAVSRPLDVVAREWNVTPAQLQPHVVRIRGKLLAARQKRPAPVRDDKILASWNGLMIRALARTGALLKRRDYVEAAEKAAEFVVRNLRDDKGRLLRTCRQKQARIPAYLDDYAFLVDGLMALHDATGDQRWANAAIRLTDQQLTLFWDEQDKGCFYTADDHELLLARVKSAYDTVLPSGNSVTVRNLVRVAALTRNAGYREKARETLELFAPLMDSNPAGVSHMLLALREYLDSAADAKNLQPARPSRPEVRPIPDESRPPRIDPTDAEKSEDKVKEIVTADVYFSTDRLPAGATGKMMVRLQVSKGWHIRANPTGSETEEPTTIVLRSKHGVKAGKIKFPTGTRTVPEDEFTDPHFIYEGLTGVLIPLEIPESAGNKKEELTIEINYQACSNLRCLAPSTLTLKVPVSVARPGETVKAINSRLFAPSSKSAKREESPSKPM